MFSGRRSIVGEGVLEQAARQEIGDLGGREDSHRRGPGGPSARARPVASAR
jgi:hypothetical protein